MSSVLATLAFWRATSCARLARDDAPGAASVQIEGGQVFETHFMVRPTTRSSRLLDEAMRDTSKQSDIVELNLKHAISVREPLKVVDMNKNGPNARGYFTYTVRCMVREAISLFYTVKEVSEEELTETFWQDSLLDIFPKKSKDEFTIVKVNKEYTCWPRKGAADASGSGFRFCTHELQFKHPKLARADVRAIDVNKKYSGAHVQINGEDALDQNGLTPLQSGVLSAVCSLTFVGASSAAEPASHVTKTDREVIASIFGGSPSHYITSLDGVSCTDDKTCTMKIEWGEATDACIHTFAMIKSVKRANEELTRLTKSIFADKWTITKITNKVKHVKPIKGNNIMKNKQDNRKK